MGSQVEIALGSVFYLRCTLCNPPKPKFFVVAQVDPLRMFLINSEMSGFAMSKAEHVAANARILVADHSSFLKHDSFVACDHLSHEYSREKLLQEVERNPSIAVGCLHTRAIEAVAEALRGNDLLPRKYLRDLLPLWLTAAGCSAAEIPRS